MVVLKGSYTVTPAEPTPTGQLLLSELDQYQLYIHLPTIFFYRPVGDSVASATDTLRDALSKALVPFYPLAGRLHWIDGGRLVLECNAMGAKLLEVESQSTIDDLGDFTPTPEIKQLAPRVDYSTPIEEQPLLLVQLTRFRCGGLCVGVAMSHTVADGQSGLHFINSWAKIARGDKLETLPILDRTVLQASCHPLAAPRFDHVEFNLPPTLIGESDEEEERKKELTMVMLKLTRDRVEKLKKKANEGRTEQNNGRAYSRYEVVTGHMWRCACKARSLDSQQLTILRIPVDCRNRLRPPLPKEYFGNAIFLATPTSGSGELLANPLSYASRKIREAVEKMTDEYVRSTIDFLRSQRNLKPFRIWYHEVGRQTQGIFFGNPNLAVTSWIGLPINVTDFGWGKPIYMGPGSLGLDERAIVFPSCNGDGSFIVALHMQVAYMDDFKKLFYEDIN